MRKREKPRNVPTNYKEVIMNMLYDQNIPRRKVVLFMADNWDISESTAYEVIYDFYKEISDMHRDDFKSNHHDLVLKYEDLYKKSIEDDDKRTARAILNDLAKLKGLLIDKKEIKHEGISIEYIKPKDENED